MEDFITSFLSYFFLSAIVIFAIVSIYCMIFQDKLLREVAEREIAKEEREAKNTKIVITIENNKEKTLDDSFST